jgi:hypothetical protein
VIFVRWRGKTFEEGYEILNTPSGRWYNIPTEDLKSYVNEGGIVYMNPRMHQKEEAA